MDRTVGQLAIAASALVLLTAAAGRVWGFVTVTYDSAIDTAPRWSATEVAGRGLADGTITVAIEPGFATTLATAVTGTAAPEDVAAVEAALRAAFAAWESPVLQFELTFDGPTIRDPSSGAEIDVFAVQSTDPVFSAEAFFGVTYLQWTFLADRQLTNGAVLSGNAIQGADIYLAIDRLAAVAPAFTREQQLRALQRLVTHELGHAIGLGHPQDLPAVNFDTDTDPQNAMLIDPNDPLGDLLLSANFDPLAIMDRFPTDPNALFFTSLRNDERGARDALYPAPGATPDICQPMPQAGCRSALKTRLRIHDDDVDGKDTLVWQWVKGTATAAADFGAPTSATRYSLCLYKGALPSLAGELALPPGDRWTPLTDKGFRYVDAAGSPHGVRRGTLKGGDQDKAMIIVKARGAGLPDGWLPIATTPVVAQLIRADVSTCWQGTYVGSDVRRDSTTLFKATAQ